MKRLLLMLLLAAGPALPTQAEPVTLKLISFNLRNSGADDGSN